MAQSLCEFVTHPTHVDDASVESVIDKIKQPTQFSLELMLLPRSGIKLYIGIFHSTSLSSYDIGSNILEIFQELSLKHKVKNTLLGRIYPLWSDAWWPAVWRRVSVDWSYLADFIYKDIEPDH